MGFVNIFKSKKERERDEGTKHGTVCRETENDINVFGIGERLDVRIIPKPAKPVKPKPAKRAKPNDMRGKAWKRRSDCYAVG
jgi:hypothetical protein